MQTLRSITLLIALFTLSANAFSQGNFYVISNTVITQSPNNCSPTQLDVLTYLGCRNFVNNGSTFTIANDTIKVRVSYTSSPICLGALSQPLFNVLLDTLPPGNYTIASSAILDAIKINTVYTPLTVASCCPVTSTLEASFSLADTTFCEGEPIQLLNLSGGAQTFNWYVNNTLTSTITHPVLTNLAPGTYSVRLEADSAFCSDDTTLSFTVNSKPSVSLGPDTTICQGSSVVLRASGTNAISYLWQDSTLADTLLVSNSGLYAVKIMDSLGCTNSDSVNVFVNVCTSLNEKSSEESPIFVFKNPINIGEDIWLSTNHSELKRYDFKLTSIRGLVVKQGQVTLSTTKNSISLELIESGIYFLSVGDKDQIVSTIKLIIK